MAINVNQRLNGINPLSYLGENAYQPPEFVKDGRPPTINDSQNFQLGTIWLDTTGYPNTLPGAKNIWMLVALVGYQATWVHLGSGGIQTLTSNSGGAVSPDGSGNINVIGDGTTITGVGNPGTNTITFSTVGTGVLSTLTGNSGGAVSPTAGNINVVGDGVTITVVGNPGTHTLTISTIGGEAANSFHTDIGTAAPIAGVMSFRANTQSGSSVFFTGATNVVTLSTTDSNNNTIIGHSAGNATISGSNNTGLGFNVLHALTSGNANTVEGSLSGEAITSGADNSIFGEGSGVAITTGSSNSIFGQGTATALLTGSSNSIVGQGIANNYTGAESQNIIIGSGIGGKVGANGEIKIGNTGGAGTNNNNIFIGNSAGNDTYTLPGNGQNIAIGTNALNSLTTSFYNIAIGAGALASNSGGTGGNTMVGNGGGTFITTGTQNTGIGQDTFFNALANTGLITGVSNIAVGALSGSAWTGAESNNICIGDEAVSGESATTRLGAFAGGLTPQTKCFIQGIRGITTVNNNAIAVLVDSAGQLGTVSSSVRFKENIKDMGSASEDILKLRPVTFNYKNRFSPSVSYGLIAEEVHDICPDLVVYDVEGKPETIRYHDLPALMLNEMIKMKKEIAELKALLK